MNEALQKALDSAEFLRDELREAMENGTAVESMILIPMIEQAAKMADTISHFMANREADDVKCDKCVHSDEPPESEICAKCVDSNYSAYQVQP